MHSEQSVRILGSHDRTAEILHLEKITVIKKFICISYINYLY